MSDFGWTPQAAEHDRFSFQTITPDEVLYEYDGPRIFTVKSSDGFFLFYLSSVRQPTSRYIVAPCNRDIIEDLRVGARTVLEALDQGVVWVVDALADGTIDTVWRTVLARIPGRSLPKSGTMIQPGLQPVLTLRYTGPAFEPGALKAGVLQATIQRAIDGFRKMGGGDPVIQRLQVGSLELDFAAPSDDVEKSFFPKSPVVITDVNTLEHSLRMLDADEAELFRLPSKQLQILQQLALPEAGGLNGVEIGGSMFSRRASFHIDEQKSRRIRDALATRVAHYASEEMVSSRPSRLEKVTGEIRRFDKDKMIFFLRPVGKKRSLRCLVSQRVVSDAAHLFADDATVEIIGQNDGRQISVESVQAVPRLLASN